MIGAGDQHMRTGRLSHLLFFKFTIFSKAHFFFTKMLEWILFQLSSVLKLLNYFLHLTSLEIRFLHKVNRKAQIVCHFNKYCSLDSKLDSHLVVKGELMMGKKTTYTKHITYTLSHSSWDLTSPLVSNTFAGTGILCDLPIHQVYDGILIVIVEWCILL